MALEAVVFPPELFSHPMAGGPWFYNMAGVEEDAGYGYGGAVDVINGDHQMGDDGSFTSSGAEKSPEQGPADLDRRRGSCREYPSSCSSLSTHGSEEPRDVTNCSNFHGGVASFPAAAGGGRRKRQRARRCRNREEVENQRMTHIAVERNRRRQMNEYLAELRSLMPPSYIQKGDQASIVGGAINFVKELEQLLQSLEAQKRTRQQQPSGGGAAADGGSALSPLFGGFFTFPQYYSSSPSSKSAAATTSSTSPPHCHPAVVSDGAAAPATGKVDTASAVVSAPDVEVTMVESHASLKVLSRRRRRPGQLLGVVAGLQGLRLTTLHLNVTTVGDVLALYSFSLKVEDDCQLSSANEIAAAVHQMLAGADVPGNSPSPASTQQPSSSPAAMGAVVERRRD